MYKMRGQMNYEKCCTTLLTECEKIVQFDGIHRGVAKISTYGGGHCNPGEVGAFGVFKHECGVHRVQRIPITASANKSSMLQVIGAFYQT